PDARCAPCLDNYLNVSVTRQAKKGGGVSIYILNNHSFKVCESLTFVKNSVESVAIILNNVLYVVAYRPPNGCIEDFQGYLSNVLELANTEKLKICISGDFNIDFLTPNQHALSTRDLFLSYGCFNIIQSGTRPTTKANPLLDPIFISVTNKLVHSAVLTNHISDHLPVVVELPTTAAKSQLRQSYYREFNALNIEHFKQLISTMNFDIIMRCNYSNFAYSIFENMYKLYYNNAFPLKKFTSKTRARKPYITTQLLQRMKTRDLLKQKYLETKNQADLEKYKKFRNRLSQDIYNIKRSYILNKFSRNTDAKSMWKTVNQISNFKQLSDQPQSIKAKGGILTGIEMCEYFNKYFINITDELNLNHGHPIKHFDSPSRNEILAF